MNSELLKQMADDLSINQFQDEKFECYVNRVLYSAFSLWLRTICLDGITKENESTYSISKQYHTIRGEFILNNLLDFFSENKNYFFIENEKNEPVQLIKERLINSLVIIDKKYRLYLHKTKYIPINSKFSKLLGLPNEEVFYSSGISILNKCNNEFCELEKLNIEEFYNDFISNLSFGKDEWTASKEYFNPLETFIKTNTMSKSWSEVPPKLDIYISRLKDNGNNKLYFIEKNINEIVYSSRIPDVFIESELLDKILIYTRYKNNNPIYVKVEKGVDSFTLKRNIESFYGTEEIFIQSFGWPKKSLYDLFEWSFPIYLYDDVITLMEDIFLEIKRG